MHPSEMIVLVVDDFGTMRRIISNLLKESGFSRTLEAEDGRQALQLIESTPVHMVISDWNMPVMNGLALLQAVRASPQHQHLPFLLVTAEARKENIVEAAQAGADGYIVKPFSAATLAEKVHNILRKKGTVTA